MKSRLPDGICSFPSIEKKQNRNTKLNDDVRIFRESQSYPPLPVSVSIPKLSQSPSNLNRLSNKSTLPKMDIREWKNQRSPI